MKPTPTETPCPSPSDLLRLQQQALPEADAARLHQHLRTCRSCRERWRRLQEETDSGQTPPLLHPVDDTNLGQPASPSLSSPIVWSSEMGLEGPGGQRPPAPRSPPSPPERRFPFLAPSQGAGELGWLAHYRITEVLGEGGMGVVFDAFDTHLYRRVALKVLKPDLAANLSFRERFLQEARAAAALPDEYIITIYQVGLENDVPFLAMKFLHGESLEQRLQRDGRLSVKEVLRIGREVALGLSAAHDRGLIHRDIKPANLWLETPPNEPGSGGTQRLSCEYTYRVKILDFGLARPINNDRRLTATGLIVGTPQYLAPEQARGQSLDHRCDLFSLGIVLYRMVTGVLPFEGKDTLAQLTALAVAAPRPVEELAPDVPAELLQLIHQLLARDPEKRPPTARAVAEALRALEKKDTEPTRVKRESGKENLKKRTHPPRLPFSLPSWGSRRWFLATGFGGLLLIGGLLFWHGFSHSDPEKTTAGPQGEPIKVGILFSMRGPMANGGAPAQDAAVLAIEELNKQGGLLGRPIVPVMGDGESDYRKFASEAERLITEEGVCALFGTRASSHRKAVRPIIEKYDSVLFYPMQFEGLEDSPNIVYLGAAPNQQMIPAVKWILEKHGKRRLFLIGSDYIFPHAANAILHDYVAQKYPDVKILNEKYIPFGSTQVREVIQTIKAAKPDLIVSTVMGDTHAALYRELHEAGLQAATVPVLSFTLGENDLLSLGEVGKGHYAAWSYFQGIGRPENREFVRKFRERFGERRVISDPMETVYFGVHLWAQAVQAAGSVEPRDVREAIKGLTLEAPEGTVRVDRKTRYTWRVMRIGQVGADGQFQVVPETDTEWAYPPEPFPSTRPRQAWQRFLDDLYTRWGNRWVAGAG